MDINYFRNIQNAKDYRHEKDIKVDETRERFANDFDTSINVVYTATRNDNPQDFIIVPKGNKSNEFAIYTRPDEEINIGDIIHWNRLHWIVTDKAFDNDIYNIGTIVRCNRTIKWQNPKTREIIERWCLAEKPYTSNIRYDDVISLSEREYKIIIPYDDETKIVDLDKRFMLDVIDGKPRTYTLTCVDLTTNKYQDIDGGFIIWNLVQDQASQPTDNLELGICNYIDLNTNINEDETDNDDGGWV